MFHPKPKFKRVLLLYSGKFCFNCKFLESFRYLSRCSMMLKHSQKTTPRCQLTLRIRRLLLSHLSSCLICSIMGTLMDLVIFSILRNRSISLSIVKPSTIAYRRIIVTLMSYANQMVMAMSISLMKMKSQYHGL